MSRPLLTTALVVLARTAVADPTGGVDAASLTRPSYDSNGLFTLEGARLLAKHDMSFKVQLGYEKAPLRVAVPGIGDAGADKLLDNIVTLDLAFALSLADRFEIGFDAGSYHTAVGDGYGRRGTYDAGTITKPSTGAIALRPLSNIDPSAPSSDTGAYLGDELAGPLDARIGGKFAIVAGNRFALTAIGSVSLPFGDDQMFVGDRSLVFEPKLAAEYRPSKMSKSRIVANVAARIRERTVLESYDTSNPALTAADAQAYLDIGSEAVFGLGGVIEVAPRVLAIAEAQALVSLPEAFDWGNCRLYNDMPCDFANYAPGVKRGDNTALAAIGAQIRITPDVTAQIIVGAGAGGARADEIRFTTGLVWAPQPDIGTGGGGGASSLGDRDGDGIPDSIDVCPDDPEDKDGYQDEDGCPDPDNDSDGIPDDKDKCPNDPEDKDGFQDEDGCPDPDNDHDGIPDAVDKCPSQPEDKDGFQDEDGCPDPDNDHDGFPDDKDKCPNDPETVNGFEDEDGCPDSRASAGPEQRGERIDTKGQPIAFTRGTSTLAASTKPLLAQIATLIKSRKLTVRVEVHVALGTTATAAAQIAAQQKKDKAFAQKRAQAVVDALVALGVPAAQLQPVGFGSEHPLATGQPTDAANDRVDIVDAGRSPGGAP